MLKADGFDKAFLGVASRFGMDEVFAYDYDMVLRYYKNVMVYAMMMLLNTFTSIL